MEHTLSGKDINRLNMVENVDSLKTIKKLFNYLFCKTWHLKNFNYVIIFETYIK